MRATARQAWVIGWVDVALTAALIVLSFEPFRSSSGLWHSCIPVTGQCDERWSPILLLIATVPIALGVAAAFSAPRGGGRTVAIWGTIALLLLTLFMVVVPTGSAVS